VVLVNHPAAIERIMITNHTAYAKGHLQQRRLRPALRDGLLTSEGEAWRSTRRLTAPIFTPRIIATMFADMLQATDDMAARWRAHGDAPMEMGAQFQHLSYDIVSRTIFSGALDADRVAHQANVETYFDTIGRMDFASVLFLPTWVPTLNAWRGKKALRGFQSVIYRVVAARIADKNRQGNDLLDRLIKATDSETGQALTPDAVADNILTFLTAGYDTTANTLTWTFYLLSLFPEITQRAIAEIQSVFGDNPINVADLDRLIYCRAILNEALRLYPPVPINTRLALEDDVLEGNPIAAGTHIYVAAWLTHRHRTLWTNPEAFNPERFMPGNLENIPRGAFYPFGLGPRICIGMGFGMQELLIVLATILPKFTFTLPNPDTVYPECRITLRPRGGLPMRVRAVG
jgi:cytochrome P450